MGRAGRSDHQRAADRYRLRWSRLDWLARANPRKNHGRLAGIGRRRHPGIDAEVVPGLTPAYATANVQLVADATVRGIARLFQP